MPENIEREEVKKALLGWDYDPSDDDVECAINHIPAADVVEVVRCKDCNVPHNKWVGCPRLNGLIPPPMFYCAYGERKEGAAE